MVPSMIQQAYKYVKLEFVALFSVFWAENLKHIEIKWKRVS